ncbi:MAG: DinB family protein [Thermogemmata sp.]|jgi:uncharacterized damage-inducible protein DinB|uniref:DinB family protein n=1 Tax=Thermogemmata fonticola TaxID=2755323 RepID=A0A7V8VC75_9BACT|nr:DinB family protein [Thermogemmata fonticola]MBA2225362.1 DinB family protein [Thermogemmata fonticola]MCX8138790.1 DinB family protein [Gemmataceae bacterium]GIW84782.1 MAG: hypothetical protein KatS3mg107_0442 [Gemmataceae bacterium]
MTSPAHALADEYLAGAFAVRAAVADMSREQLLARPIPGRWSTMEVVCHLADFEQVFADRIKRIIALPEPPLYLAADENLYVQALAYHERDLEEQLQLIEATRRDVARIIRHLSPEQLQKTGCHNLRGLQTLEKVIRTIINHIPHHLAFVAEKRRALGLPVLSS